MKEYEGNLTAERLREMADYLFNSNSAKNKGDNKVMEKILKYRLKIKEFQVLELPPKASIIRVAAVDGELFLWAFVSTENKGVERREIVMVKTGQEFPDVNYRKYLGFCSVFVGEELGLYVFEVKN